MRRKLGCLVLGALAAGASPAIAQSASKASGPSPSPTPLIDELRAKGLIVPVAGVTPDQLKDTFRQKRGEQRIHYAVDIVAPRGTPVLAADSGTILKLFKSTSGGLMIYMADPTERFIYYYAHLDRYRTGLKAGGVVARGDTIGFVGTTGNAPANYPHLHFAILRSYDVRRWSKGMPINPVKVF